MLLNDFYIIEKFENANGLINGTLTLNSKHSIFKGHFPDFPIVPGVVLIQIIKEILEFNLESKLLLVEAKSVKFLDFINPLKTNKMQFEIIHKSTEEGMLKIQAIIKSEHAIHFKFSADYKPYNN